MNSARRNAGFNLIEVIAVIVLLGVGVVAILSLFASGTRSLGMNVNSQISTQLAQQRAEQVLADRRNPARGFGYITAANYPDETPVFGAPNYSRTVRITNPFASPACPAAPVNCKQVVVTVTSAGVNVANATFMVVNY